MSGLSARNALLSTQYRNHMPFVTAGPVTENVLTDCQYLDHSFLPADAQHAVNSLVAVEAVNSH